MRSLLLNKKAASVVISTLILSAGVLGMGIAVLYWAYSMGSIATRTYSMAEGNSSIAIQERLGFEWTDYSSSTNNITVNIINWGYTNNVTIAHVNLLDSRHQSLGGYDQPTLYNLTTSETIPSLSITDEGYCQLTAPTSPLPAGLYYIRIVTGRGRTFDGSFAVP